MLTKITKIFLNYNVLVVTGENNMKVTGGWSNPQPLLTTFFQTFLEILVTFFRRFYV